jgi:hypothetical protein
MDTVSISIPTICLCGLLGRAKVDGYDHLVLSKEALVDWLGWNKLETENGLWKVYRTDTKERTFIVTESHFSKTTIEIGFAHDEWWEKKDEKYSTHRQAITRIGKKQLHHTGCNRKNGKHIAV